MNVTVLVASFPFVPVVVAVIIIAIFVTVVVTVRNADRDAALRAETENARRVAEDAKCVAPAAAQPKPKRRPKK